MASLRDKFDSPLLRVWELNSTSSHYDRQVAAPSDEELLKMWIAWSVAIYAIAIYAISVLVALLLNKKARSQPFNLFLIYLMIPDALTMWLCGSTCLANALKGHYTSLPHCKFRIFYIVVMPTPG